MSNLAEIELEKKFQEDIAKATALSIESQALDEYRRRRLHGAYYERTNSSEALQSTLNETRYGNHRPSSFNLSKSGSTDIPPPIPAALQRRHSEVVGSPAVKTSTDSDKNENDLISFASPTSKRPQSSNYDKLIEDIQKLNTQLVPASGHQAHPQIIGYAPQTTTQQMYSAASGLQLVPFIPTQQQQQQQKIPLTNEELQKLYSMPQQLQHCHYAPPSFQHNVGFSVPSQYAHSTSVYHYPQSASNLPSTAAGYTQYPPSAYGFQYNAFSHQFSNQPLPPQSTQLPPAADIPSSIQQVANPTTALVPQKKLSNSSAVPNLQRQFPNGILPSNGYERRKTPPVKKFSASDDLIDLSQNDDPLSVSVLEAFDPLLNEDDYVWK